MTQRQTTTRAVEKVEPAELPSRRLYRKRDNRLHAHERRQSFLCECRQAFYEHLMEGLRLERDPRRA